MAEYNLDGSVLYVRGELIREEDRNLHEWCARLMETNEPQVSVDLSAVTLITSTCIGVLSAAWVDILTQDRKIIMIVSPAVRRVLTLTGFHRVLELRDP